MRVGSLCSGYGGLDLAVQNLWPCAMPAWHSEVDQHASKVLEVRWPDTPNLGDLTTIDWASVAPVDVLTAGYPCQPFSTAGRRKGEDDERHLWPGVLRAVRDLRPRLVLLENVAGHLSLGFGRVLGDLAEAGYVGSWTCLRASVVGACHRRERVFIAAHPDGTGRQVGHGLPRPHRGTGPVRSVGAAADADVEPAGRHSRTAPRPQEPNAGRRDPHVGDRPADGAPAPSHADCKRSEGWAEPDLRSDESGQCPSRRDDADRRGVGLAPFGVYQPAVDRWADVIGRPAPPGLDGGRLNARFVEWMMGLPEGWVTDLVPRRHTLRILGNGVVPQQASAAYRSLLASLDVAKAS